MGLTNKLFLNAKTLISYWFRLLSVYLFVFSVTLCVIPIPGKIYYTEIHRDKMEIHRDFLSSFQYNKIIQLIGKPPRGGANRKSLKNW